MSLDPFADALIHIKNSDFVAKKECVVKPVTKTLNNVLEILKKEKYIKDFEKKSKDNKEFFIVKLNGNIINCKAIKPRFAVKAVNFEKYEKRFLPAKGIGLLIVSTPKGIITHIDAKKQNLGGRLIAYIY